MQWKVEFGSLQSQANTNATRESCSKCAVSSKMSCDRPVAPGSKTSTANTLHRCRSTLLQLGGETVRRVNVQAPSAERSNSCVCQCPLIQNACD